MNKFARLPARQRILVIFILIAALVLLACGGERIGYRSGNGRDAITVNFAFKNGGHQSVQAYWCAHYSDGTAKCDIGGGQYISFTDVTGMQ